MLATYQLFYVCKKKSGSNLVSFVKLLCNHKSFFINMIYFRDACRLQKILNNYFMLYFGLRHIRSFVIFEASLYSKLRYFRSFVIFKASPYTKLCHIRSFAIFEASLYLKLRHIRSFVVFKASLYSKLRRIHSFTVFEASLYLGVRYIRSFAIFKASPYSKLRPKQPESTSPIGASQGPEGSWPTQVAGHNLHQKAMHLTR